MTTLLQVSGTERVLSDSQDDCSGSILCITASVMFFSRRLFKLEGFSYSFEVVFKILVCVVMDGSSLLGNCCN